MKIGFIGLGKMGMPMITRLIAGGHQVVGTDVNQNAVALAAQQGVVAAADRNELVAKLSNPAVIWLMIPAQFVQAEIEALLPLLVKGSIIVDGGNSDFRHTRERAAMCAQSGVELVDVGTSGGVLGLEKGFSMMIGGTPGAVTDIEPLIKALAQPGGYRHFGPSGAGHFVKMVHNGIEYGIMEAYAEGFRVLRETEYSGLDLPAIADVWQHGSIIAGNLNWVAGQALKINPTLDGIQGTVAESGETRWMLESAQAHHVDTPVIQTALQVRLDSQKGSVSFATKLLAAMRNVFGGHPLNK